MTIYLRQSTASQEVPLGYFVDSTDGNTEETGLSIANTDIKIWKNGATTLANKNSGGATHISNGIYYCVLDATDTNTLGPLVIFVHVSGALTVRLECCVLAANVFDSLIGGGDLLDVNTSQFGNTNGTFASGRPEVNTTHVGGTSQTARDLGASVLLSSGTGTGQVTLTSGRVNADLTHIATAAVSASTAQLGVNVVNFGGSAGTFASGIPAVNSTQISGDATAADNCESFFDGTGYAGTNNVIPTVTTLTNAPSDSSGVTTLLGRLTSTRAGYLDNLSAGAVATATKLLNYFRILCRKDSAVATDLSTEIGEINANTGAGTGSYAVSTDSQEAIRDNMGTAQTGDSYARIGSAGAGLTAIIGADGDTLKTISGQIDGLTTSAGPQVLASTTIASLSSQTSFTLTAGSADNDAYNGAVAIITDQSTATQKAVATILDYVGSTKTVTLAADPGIFTMATGDSIAILANISSAPSAATIRAEIDSNSTKLASIEGDTQDIQSRIPAALVSGRIDASVGAYQSGLTPLQPTTAGRTLDVSAGGEAGIDWANVGGQSTSVNLSGTTTNLVNTLTTYTGNTVQTGDSYARIGSTGSGLTTLATAANQTTILNRLGSWTGTGVNTLLGAFKALLSKSASTPSDIGGTFDASTDSTEAIRDRGDAAWITATGFSTLTAADVNAQCDQALADYDAPTKAEMDSAIATVATLAAQSTQTGLLGGLVNSMDSLVDPSAEVTGPPAATSTMMARVAWLFKLARNKITQTDSTQTVYADDGTTPNGASAHSDDGTTHTRGEWS